MQPSKNCGLKLFDKWKETGSVLDVQKQCAKCALTEQALENIQLRMEMSPRK